MGATPRPWSKHVGEPTPDSPTICREDEAGECDVVIAQLGDGLPRGLATNDNAHDDADLIIRAVNAFDALLAVAKAAAEATAVGWVPGEKWKVDTAVVALYAAHPGWREWAP